MRLASSDAEAPAVLVVDDEPEIRDLLSTIHRREGYAVETRADGAAALDAVRAARVDVLITDMKMPGITGLELIRQARGIRPELGSILITGYASTETAVTALRSGADDFVTKPFEVEDLRRVVGRVLSARRMVRQERDALDRARDEAETLRQKSRDARVALEHAQRDLHFSQRDLERRVKDLEFLRDLTGLLTKEEGLQRILETTARVLAARFQSVGTRIEVLLPDGSHVASHEQGASPARRLAALAPDLLARARASAKGVVRDVVLGLGQPMEILAAPLALGGSPPGGSSSSARRSPPPTRATSSSSAWCPARCPSPWRPTSSAARRWRARSASRRGSSTRSRGGGRSTAGTRRAWRGSRGRWPSGWGSRPG
jgi:CheY-like chemotaxis protein